MKAQLIPLDGGQPILLTKDVTLVGRKSKLCDLIVERVSVSKLHCLIVKTDGLLFIRDLGSTNGTKVNGQRVTRGALLPGDELAFAGAKFRIDLGPDELPGGASNVGYLDTSADIDAGGIADGDSESDVRLLSDEDDF